MWAAAFEAELRVGMWGSARCIVGIVCRVQYGTVKDEEDSGGGTNEP